MENVPVDFLNNGITDEQETASNESNHSCCSQNAEPDRTWNTQYQYD